MTASEFTSVNEFLDGLHFDDHENYNDKQWEFIHQLQLKEMYLNMANSIDESYEEIDIPKLGEAEIREVSS